MQQSMTGNVLDNLNVPERVVLAFLTIEVLLIASAAYAFYRVVFRRAIVDELYAGTFEACMCVFEGASVGVGFLLLLVGLSYFQNGLKAEFMRIMSLVPFFICGWVGLIRGAWRFLTF